MIDPGAAISFITGRIVSSLRAKRIPSLTHVTGLEETQTSTSYFKIEAIIRDPANPEASIDFSPAVVSSITGTTPTSDLRQSSDLCFARNLRLADPNFGQPERINILLGLDIIPRISLQGLIVSPSKDLSANETIFGWVISGYFESPSQAVTAHICCRAETSSKTDELVRAFWESEEPPTDANNISSDEQLAITHFQDTFRRDSNGRYIVALPFKEFQPSLGQSRPMAAKRLEQNQRILVRKDKWCAFQGAVDEYQVLDHAEVVPQSDLKKLPSDTFYLPMHGVEKEASTTTKLRIVSDASAKTTSGYSLNVQLLTGPNLCPLLTNEI